MNKKQDKEKTDSPLKFYAKYSSLGLQMIAIILFGVFGGMALDNWLKWEFPVFTLVFTILAVILSMVYGTKDLLKKK